MGPPVKKLEKTLGLAPPLMFYKMQSSACNFLGGIEGVAHYTKIRIWSRERARRLRRGSLFSLAPLLGSVNAGEAGLRLHFDRKESPADPLKNR